MLRVVGAVAGIGGIALGVLLLVYRDFFRSFIQARAFSTLTSAQATFLLAGAIFLTFAAAVLGIFAGFVSDARDVAFVVLVAVLLVFAVVLLRTAVRSSSRRADTTTRDIGGLLDAGQLEAADRAAMVLPATGLHGAARWYWMSQVALARQNPDVARAYVEEALRHDARRAASIAQKIRLLLLAGEHAAARDLAERSRGVSDALEAWLRCLGENDLFAPGVTTNRDIDTRCPPPSGATG